MDQALLRSAKQWDNRQRAEIEALEVPPEHEELFLLGIDCPERLWVVPHWRYSRTIWTPSCAICSGVTLLDDQMTIVVPFQPDPLHDSASIIQNRGLCACVC